MNYRFDNSYIGPIDDDICEKIGKYDNTGKLKQIRLKNGLLLNVTKYVNNFTLILEDIKPVFEVLKTKYHIANVDGTDYLIYKSYNSVKLSEYHKSNKNFKRTLAYYDLQRTFVFNWLMCLNVNESKIYVFPSFDKFEVVDVLKSDYVFFKIINEKSFICDAKNNYPTKTLIDKWFDGSYEKFFDLATLMTKDINPSSLKILMNKIIIKYDSKNTKNYEAWINAVQERLFHIPQDA